MRRISRLLAGIAFGLGVLGSAQAQDVVPERILTIIRDSDLPGADLRPIFDTTLADCAAACQADDACTAFTFNSRNGSCFPKSGAPAAEDYAGAFSGIFQITSSAIRARAEERRSTLTFLTDADIANAFDQAEGLGLVHYGGLFSATDWRTSAERAFDNGNIASAIRMIGAGITRADLAADWTEYARYMLLIDPENRSEARQYEIRALEAAVNATLRADPGPDLARAFDWLSEALERRGRGRDALDAMRLAMVEEPNDTRDVAVDRLIGLYGFRVTDTRVDAEADFPRICAIFSEPLAAGGVSYDDYLQSPTSGLAVEAEGRQLCISGVRHGQRYEFALRAGLPAASGEVLNAPATFRQYVRDRAPTVRFAGRAYILPATADGTIPLVAVNTDLVDLRLFHVADRNILRALQEQYFGRPLAEWEVDRFAEQIGEAVWSGEVEVAMEQNRGVTTRVPIGDVLAGRAPGLYALEASVGGAGDSEGGATQWFLVSDIGITAMSGADGVHVTIRSLASTVPMGGDTVDLISESNRILASAETDADGHVLFAAGLANGESGAAPALVTVRNGDTDLAFLSLRDAEFDLSDRGVEGREPPGPIDVFLTTDRGAYRAGETIHATALARDPQADALIDLPLTAILTRADGVEYTRDLLQEVGAGGYVFSLPLGAEVPRGTWRLAIHTDPDAAPLTETRLLVEDFLPERLDLAIDLPSTQFAAGANVLIDFRARYLYGAPADGLPITGRMALRPTQTLPDHPGYAFGRHDVAPDAEFASFGPLETDTQGGTAAGLTFPDFQGTPHPGLLTLTAEITETSGRPVERRDTVTILPRGAAIGIRALFDGPLPEGSEAPFDLIAIGAADPVPATWTLNRVERRYQWYRQNGRWAWEPIVTRQRIATGDVTLDADPTRLDMPVDWGSYELRVESDAGGFTISSVGFEAGWFASGDSADTPDALEVSLDAERYSPGDTATLRIVPRNGGLTIIRVVSDRLIHEEVVEVGDDATEIPLTVTDDWGAGAYVTATLIRPLDTVSGPVPARALGLAYAAVDPGARALQATLELPETIRPRAPLDVALRVDGIPAGETVYATIAAVDVGILNLTGFDSPDPQAYYFGLHRLGVAFRDIYGRLIDNRDGAEGRIRQGGDGTAGLRAEATPPTEELVALFSGPLTVGTDGYARAQFDIPAFNGTVRVMATAWSETGVGQAEADVIVRDPVVVTASAPRFLAPGDTARLLLELTHVEGPTGAVPIAITTTTG